MSVESINIAAPSWYTVSGAPLTTSGTITIAPNPTLSGNLILGTPPSGGPLELRTLTSADFPTVQGVAGSYTNPSITVNNKGLITAISTGTSVGGRGSGTVTAITAGTGLAVNGVSGTTITTLGTITLDTTAVTAGSYTLSSITVDTYGRVTSASSGTAGANTALSNLASTAINVDLLPGVDGLPVLGNASKRFAGLHLYEGATINWDAGDVQLTQSGNTLTVTGGEFIIDASSGPTSTSAGGFRGVPQNSKSADYTTVLTDAGKHIYHPTTDNNARTFTIDSNANVAYPIGTTLKFINDMNTVTIAITSDTLVLAGTGSTGSRTLAVNGIALATKVTSTRWYIEGTGLS